MSVRYRSPAYQVLKDRVAKEMSTPGWEWGKVWLRRVGLVRLTAENVARAASGMLYDINPSTHRDDPELKALLYAARAAADDYATAITRDNWRRFEGRPKV